MKADPVGAMTRVEHQMCAHERAVQIATGPLTLSGILGLPAGPRGIILFAHGSGSGRFSPRNQLVARHLQQNGLATLLFDLLTPEEGNDRDKIFDIGLLADRLILAASWLDHTPDMKGLGIGYFGASTGAGAALHAAALQPALIRAVVSRGGRPDLAAPYLPSVTAPTLLIVGEQDESVMTCNHLAYERLVCEKKLLVISGATHLFTEPGTLEQVADHACRWFQKHILRDLPQLS